MDSSCLKVEKSTLRFLTSTLRVTRSLISEEFGPATAKAAQISFSRKMYFTLGRCWSAETKIAFNLAWVVLNRKTPEHVWALIVHEVAHLRDPLHGEGFLAFCAKYGVDPGDIRKAKTLPPASWLLCATCGDNQGLLFSTRLSAQEVKDRFSGMTCRKCGSEIEYRELSDKGFRKVSEKIRKLRIYGTTTWENLRVITH